MAFGLTKKEVSWVLYDVGNSAFVMLSTALIPVYFASLAEEGSSVVVAWGYAETVASLILALLMPLLGSLADLAGNKKKFLVGFAGTGAVACAALGVPQHALAFLVVYVIAAIMLNGSMVFYDAFLIDATTAVSYTHLDVYKRQVRLQALLAAWLHAQLSQCLPAWDTVLRSMELRHCFQC